MKPKRILVFLLVYLLGLLTPVILLAVGNPFALAFSVGLAMTSTERVEVIRSISPDGLVDAVLLRENPGVLSDFRYLLYLVPSGHRISGAPVLDARALLDEDLQWNQPRMLELAFAKGQIKHFENVWERQAENGRRHTVEIRLSPTSSRLVYQPSKAAKP